MPVPTKQIQEEQPQNIDTDQRLGAIFSVIIQVNPTAGTYFLPYVFLCHTSSCARFVLNMSLLCKQ